MLFPAGQVAPVTAFDCRQMHRIGRRAKIITSASRTGRALAARGMTRGVFGIMMEVATTCRFTRQIVTAPSSTTASIAT